MFQLPTGALAQCHRRVDARGTPKSWLSIERAGRAAHGRPTRSEVVSLAIREYADKIGQLGAQERIELLKLFDQLVPKIPPRPAAEVERELRAIRAGRHRGGRAVRPRR